MNATINGIIDHMFRNTADNAESRALHEELLNNCLEHYEDLVSRGMSETEAIDAVVDSLKGMKEVIDELPKKPGYAAEEKQVPYIQVEEKEKKEETKQAEPPKEKRTEYTFDPATVRVLKTDMKGCDLQIGPSPDGLIHVRCEEMDQMICEASSGVLRVRVADVSSSVADDPLLSGKDISARSILNFLGKALGSAVSRITVSWNVYIDLPASALEEMELDARSGDIVLKTAFPKKISAHTASGDVRLESDAGETALKIEAGSMSGEVEVFGNADALTLTSMSGEVTAKGTFGTVVMKSTSGDVQLTGYAESLRLNSVSGDVNADLRNTDVRLIEAAATSGDVEIKLAPGTDSVSASMRTVSGSASCKYPDAGQAAALKISAASVSGDVRIG